jgi:RimJ/RimL family protein N-acetyltransferase
VSVIDATDGETLSTPRLLLRRWREDDLDAHHALSGDPEVMRHIGAGVPYTREQSRLSLAAFGAHWERHGFGLLAAVERDGGAPIGMLGVQRAGEPGVGPGDVEIGWRLMRSHWGRGLATEGATAVRDHAFGVLGLARLVAFCRPANGPSIRVAEQLGLTTVATRRCRRGLPMLILALDRAEWAEWAESPPATARSTEAAG